jgi:hypothetical protein
MLCAFGPAEYERNYRNVWNFAAVRQNQREMEQVSPPYLIER